MRWIWHFRRVAFNAVLAALLYAKAGELRSGRRHLVVALALALTCEWGYAFTRGYVEPLLSAIFVGFTLPVIYLITRNAPPYARRKLGESGIYVVALTLIGVNLVLIAANVLFRYADAEPTGLSWLVLGGVESVWKVCASIYNVIAVSGPRGAEEPEQ